MKILASKHLEAQIDWFAKRGFSCLGVLIIFGSSADAISNEILYHLFISDDTTQDTDAINTVKHFLYKEILPKYGMANVHFRCDGAAAFNCAKSKAAMPRWSELTDIFEISYKVSVSGGGKTSLDGLFGILTQHLKRLVNYGHSYSTAEELYNLLVKFPLRHTEFHLYLPKRRHLIDWSTTKAIDDLSLKSFYLMTYDVESRCTKAYYHSRHSKGIHLKAIDAKCEETNTSYASSNENESIHGGQYLLSKAEDNKTTVRDLKEMCKELGLPVSGKKAILQERLKDKIFSQIAMAKGQEEDDESSKSEQTVNENLKKRRRIAYSLDRSGDVNLDESVYGDESDDSSGEDIYSDESSFISSDEDASDDDDSENEGAYRSESDDGHRDDNSSDEDECGHGDDDSLDDDGMGDNPNKESDLSFDNYDPWIHIVKSTWLNNSTTKRGEHSKTDFMTRRIKENKDFMGRKNKKFEKMHEDQIQILQDAGLHICTAINENEVDQERCTCKFMFRNALEKHKKRCEEGKAHHVFPRRDLLSDVLADATSGKWALALACGSMPNRCQAMSQDIVIENGTLGDKPLHSSVPNDWFSRGCYRRDTRKKNTFRASLELVKDLQLLYLAGERRDGGGEKKNASKYTPSQAIARLANMKDEQGRRKYSYRQGNPNGPLPSEAYVRSWFSRQKSSKKKDKHDRSADAYDAMDIDHLRKTCTDRLFDGREKIKAKDIVIKMLMLDSTQRDENDVCDYNGMRMKELDELRKARALPTANSKKSFKYMLRMQDKVEATNTHFEQVQHQFESVLAISDAMETVHDI